ncbi:uncharacterized protein PAF06_010027 [Gastrophryne carolinensis]
MGRMLVMVILLLGGACPGELPSSHLTLKSTQKSFESFLISCMVKDPEERVAQVHWKERRPDGKFSMIAVQNPNWGNITQTPYNAVVKLNKLDEATYTLEIMEADKVVCCEVVTYPSGMIRESCLTIEGDTGDPSGIQAAVLGISGFFIIGSFVLLCHIFWMKKISRRVHNIRGASQQVWNRDRRSSVPYSRTQPSINLAYEPSPDTDILHNEVVQRTVLGNPLTIEVPPPSSPQYHEIPPLSNQWLSEASAIANPPSNPHSSVPSDTFSTTCTYSNIHRLKRLQHLQTSHQEPPGLEAEAFPDAGSTRPKAILTYNITAAPWLCGERSHLSKDTSTLQPPRLRVPRTPDSPLTTINPMYHSGTGWAPQHGNTHLINYKRVTLS